MKNLKLCPCCGDYGFLMNDSDSIRNYYGLPCWFVQCLNCGMRTPKGEQDEVINIWNRREVNYEKVAERLEEEMD